MDTRLPARPAAFFAALLTAAVALSGCFTPPTGPPQTTAQVDLTANSAAWGYEYPGGIVHGVRGEYYLNVNATVHNRGSIPTAMLAAEFTIHWATGVAGIPAMATSLTTTIAAGATLTATVTFLSTEILTPTRLEFLEAGFTNSVSATVPAPSALPVEVSFTGLTAAWSANDSSNGSASPGNVFLWVNFTLQNHWHGAVGVDANNFKVEDANGSSHSAASRIGIDQIAVSASGSETVIFEVPVGFAPTKMLYDDILGPWTDVALPTPH